MDTRLVRCIAVLLIANSHLTSYYPIPQLAGDGLLGNSLFFLLSGFGVAMSDRKRLRSPIDWFSRRLQRIYPSLFIVLAFSTAYEGGTQWAGDDGILWGLLWPVRYPFVRQITTFYVIYFLWSRLRLKVSTLGLIVASFPVYVIWGSISSDIYRTHALHWVYYFQMLLLGVALARSTVQTHRRAHDLAAIALPFTFLIYVATKFVLSRAGETEQKVYLLHLLAVPVILAMMSVLSDARLLTRLDRFPRLARFADWLAGSTFEVYLVHTLVMEVDAIRDLPLPANLAAFWLGTFAAAAGVHLVRDAILGFASRIKGSSLQPVRPSMSFRSNREIIGQTSDLGR